MSGKMSEKYERIRTKIEKTITPHIMLIIPMPQGVDKDAFMALERNSEFLESVVNHSREWLSTHKDRED
jgi:hypothetical protein